MKDFQIHYNGSDYSVFYEYWDGSVYWETVQDGFKTKEDAKKWVKGTSSILTESEETRESDLWVGIK